MNTLIFGSSLIDLFIHVEDEKHLEVKESKLILSLGDKIPIEISRLAIGGNGANVSVGLTRLEIPSVFYTYLGNDIFSRQIEETIRSEGVELVVDRGESSQSSLSLILSVAHDRVIFSHHEIRSHAFSYKGEVAEFSYITSLGREWEGAYQQVFDYLKNNGISYAFAPGSSQMQDQNEIFNMVLSSCNILFINREEAESILSTHGKTFTNINDMLNSLKSLGAKLISVTDGGQGAYLLSDTNVAYHIKPFAPPAEVVEKTGAGDSYASGFLAGYLHKMELSECMRWGAVNAAYSMKEVGAQAGLVTKKQMEQILSEHSDFKAEKI